MPTLVGYTGFVGSNIYACGKFEAVYNSKNIETAYGTKPELLIYAGLRAEKFLANTNPDADMALIEQAKENIRKIAPKRLVLVSTIDVFKNPNGKNEDAEVDCNGLHPYGLNRYRLEQWVREYDPNALIVRLPALYGINLKKNFIYDFIHVIPSMLKDSKYSELAAKDPSLAQYYSLQPNGFYKCNPLDARQTDILKEKFRQLGFTALNFTDSRSVYQFYPLSRLWDDIQTALKHDLRLWHPATEPVSAGELYHFLTGNTFINEIAQFPAYYDFRTKHASAFGGNGNYIITKEQILTDIRAFVGGN